jgi:hypothetical protein
MSTPAIPTMQNILSDWRKWTRNGKENVDFQTVRAVSRWVRCGHDLAVLPLMFTGLTPEIVERGILDAKERMAT